MGKRSESSPLFRRSFPQLEAFPAERVPEGKKQPRKLEEFLKSKLLRTSCQIEMNGVKGAVGKPHISEPVFQRLAPLAKRRPHDRRQKLPVTSGRFLPECESHDSRIDPGLRIERVSRDFE